jgi:hypothetical protein
MQRNARGCSRQTDREVLDLYTLFELYLRNVHALEAAIDLQSILARAIAPQDRAAVIPSRPFPGEESSEGTTDIGDDPGIPIEGCELTARTSDRLARGPQDEQAHLDS